MAYTYSISFDLPTIADLVQLQPNPPLYDEQELAVAAIKPTLQGNPGLPEVIASAPFALYNDFGSGVKLNVVDIDLRETQGRTVASTAFSYGFERCSAMDGGDVADLVSLDSTATLPSQVLVRSSISSFTTVGGTQRRILSLQQLNPNSSIAFPPWRTPGGSNDQIALHNSTDVQAMVLREGQGFVAMTTASTGAEPWPLATIIVFTDGTNTFVARERSGTGIFPAMLGVFNGVGSGVVLQIVQVLVAEVVPFDSTGTMRRFQLETISGARGDSIPVTPFDTNNPALPAAVKALQKAACRQMSADSINRPARSNEHWLRRLAMPSAGVGPGLTTPFLNWPMVSSHVFDQNTDSPLVLLPGEGIALFQRQTYTGNCFNYQLSCTFSVEDYAAGGSSRLAGPVIGSPLIRGRMSV